MESMGNLNCNFVRTLSSYKNPRIGAYMKTSGDARELKKLDIKVSYRHKLREVPLIFDNIIAKKGRASEKASRSLNYQGLAETL